MFARLRACCRGAVAVEAAFVLPVMILLLMATIEFSLVFFTLSTMQHAARDLTRQMAVNLIDQATAEAAVADYLPGWTAGDVTITVAQTTPLDPATNQIGMTLSLPAGAAAPTNLFLQLMGATNLTATMVMKQELPL